MKSYMMRCMCFILLFRFTLSSLSESEMSVERAFFATSEILEYPTENYENVCALLKFSAIVIGQDSLKISVEGLSSDSSGDINKVFSLARDLAYLNASWRTSYTTNFDAYKGDVVFILDQLKIQTCRPPSNMVTIIVVALLGLSLSWNLGWYTGMTKGKSENICYENKNTANKSFMDGQDNESISSILSEGNSEDPSVHHKKEEDADGDRRKNEENNNYINEADVKLPEDHCSIEDLDLRYGRIPGDESKEILAIISPDYYYPYWQ